MREHVCSSSSCLVLPHWNRTCLLQHSELETNNAWWLFSDMSKPDLHVLIHLRPSGLDDPPRWHTQLVHAHVSEVLNSVTDAGHKVTGPYTTSWPTMFKTYYFPRERDPVMSAVLQRVPPNIRPATSACTLGNVSYRSNVCLGLCSVTQHLFTEPIQKVKVSHVGATWNQKSLTCLIISLMWD